MTGAYITTFVGRLPDGSEQAIPVYWSAYARPGVVAIDGRTWRQTDRLADGRWRYAADPEALITDRPEVARVTARLVDLVTPIGIAATVWMGEPIPASLLVDGVSYRVEAHAASA